MNCWPKLSAERKQSKYIFPPKRKEKLFLNESCFNLVQKETILLTKKLHVFAVIVKLYLLYNCLGSSADVPS